MPAASRVLHPVGGRGEIDCYAFYEAAGMTHDGCTYEDFFPDEG